MRLLGSTLAPVVGWLRRAHGAKAEIGLVLVLYLIYEGGRGLVADSFGPARRHAELVIATETSIHLFWERGIQRAVLSVDGLTAALGAAYMTLHIGATLLLLVWLYRRHRDFFPLARTALIVATALALVVHIAFPTAPPRLIGVASDTVTDTTHVNLNSHVLGALYNPIAAMPSLHFGYALLVGLMVARLGRSLLVRTLGIAYPPLVLFVIVATGNHFILDAAAGAAVMVAGIGGAMLVCREAPARSAPRVAHATRAEKSVRPREAAPWILVSSTWPLAPVVLAPRSRSGSAREQNSEKRERSDLAVT
jgi:hypothetical protein